MWKILIVDDEAIERNALSEIIGENFGYNAEIRTASNGENAVEIALLWKADIILMDIEMPVLNGVKATAAIKRALPSCQVVFLTAYGLFEYAQEAVRLGVSDYILKPAEDEDVLSAVRSAMEKHKKAANKHKTAVAPSPQTDEPNVPTDKNTKIMLQVQSYLQQNYPQDISLDSLATTLNFSPFYFSKLFKQYFGVTFVEYLTDIRIDVAKEMLADPTKSAKDIGELVGYPNSNYFVKLFKKKTGKTPTEYRNSVL